MKIVIAPDKLKGSLSAVEAATAIADGARRAAPNSELDACPLADGGEGTLDAVATAGLERRRASVTGPAGAPVSADWLWDPAGRTAILESAQAVGLHWVGPAERDALAATSAGMGELVLAALAVGARRIVITLGGSGTTDGGAGMLSVLGARFSDDGVDLTKAIARLADVELVVAWDVDSPLLGEHGAARMFAPQKGATSAQVVELERRLERLSQRTRPELAKAPGAGAAGGLGFGALVLGARSVRGTDWVLDRVGFDARLNGAALVLTAEGRLDEQSLRGKTVIGVAERARSRGVPVVALAGSVDVSAAELRAHGVTAAFSLCPRPVDPDTALGNARAWLTKLSEHVVSLSACWGTAP